MTIPMPGGLGRPRKNPFEGLDPAGGGADLDDEKALGPRRPLIDSLSDGLPIGFAGGIGIGHRQALFRDSFGLAAANRHPRIAILPRNRHRGTGLSRARALGS